MTDASRLNYSTTTYRELAEDLDVAAKWLESIGLSISPTRLGDYRRRLTSIVNALDAGELVALFNEEGIKDTIDALYEASEWRLIHQMLADTEDPGLHERLAAFVKGPIAYRDEKTGASSNRARNIGFELSLGAFLKKAGFPIEFHPDGDLRFHYHSHDWYVECKRPQSSGQVKRRVKEALEQLVIRYAEAPDPDSARGLVAVSSTKIINPFGGHFQTQSRQTLRSDLTAEMEKFSKAHDATWINHEDERTLGGLVEYRAFAIVLDENRPTTGGDVALVTRTPLSDANEELLASFARQIQSGIFL